MEPQGSNNAATVPNKISNLENFYSVLTEVFKSLLLNYGHLKQTDTFNHAAPALPKKESNTRPSFKSYFQSYIGQGSEGLRGVKNKFNAFVM